MKLTKNCVKNLTKKILPILCSLLLVFISVFTISNFSPASNVFAMGGVPSAVANQIKYYLKSVSGVVNKTVDGIGDIPQTMDDNLTQYIIDNLNGNGIYEDGNGNYVFSNNFMQGFYNILNSNSSIDAYVCSNFSSFDDGVSSPYTNSDYNDKVVEYLASAKSRVDSSSDYVGYICSCSQSIYNNASIVAFFIYLIPNDFGYINCSDPTFNPTHTYSFYSKTSSSMYLPAYYIYQTYNLNNNSFSNFDYRDSTQFSAVTVYTTSVSTFGRSDLNEVYNSFPNFTGNNTVKKLSIFSTDSTIIAKTASSGNTYINQNTYIAYNTVNNTDITISTTAIQNNNWQNIYNKYVTNVTNEYNQGSDLTRKDVQKIIKKYTDVLMKNIADGIEDLEGKIDDTNEWLDKISRQIDEINAYLEEIANNLDNGVGGDGCVWTEEDVTRVKQILERFYLYSDDYLNALNDIDTNTDNLESDVLAVKTAIDNLKSYLETWKQKIDYIPTIANNTTNTDQKVGNIQTTLVTVSTALNTIISKLDGIGSGSNVDVTIPSIDPDIIDDIVDITEDKLDDLAGLLDVVGYVLQDAMPFCFVALAGVVVNALSAEPVAPDWVIPLSNSDGSISESMELDLSIFDGIHELWISLITILFVFGLISASFKIFQTFGVLVN